MANLFKKAAVCTDIHFGLKSNSQTHKHTMNILIVGDSLSHTCGFVEPEGKLWVSPLIGRHHVTNLSMPGQSNYKIFTKAMSTLSRNPTAYDLVIIQWSSLFRLTFNDNFSIYEHQKF